MRRALLLAVGVFLALAAPAEAVHFRRPFNPDVKVTAHFDEDRRVGPQLDYACGTYTYDNHTGTDFGVYFTDALAVADATVIAVSQGCADYGGLGNQCGAQCGNQVRLRLDDGTIALYCHLKNGSIAVGVGQRVGCGQRLATSASSGSSTGPHLHVTWQRSGVLTSTYAGSCSPSPGAWTQQRGYIDAPGTACEVTCECSPGQVQEEGCGRCGVRRRWCGGDCHWGGWSGCEGEGPCWPGQVDEQRCCDCGTTRRGCGGNCQWGGWSECAGPDPAGAPSCDTGLKGVCKDGTQRCVRGCLTCAQTVQPSEETCDERDNDCDGATDEGNPQQLGSPPPGLAARIVDASFPRHLPPGTVGEAWVVFHNDGRETWRARETWLRADAPASGTPSALAPPSGWPAFDTVAVLDHDVAPGADARFVFPVSLEKKADHDAAETFSLLVQGRPIACPEGSLDVAVASVTATVTPTPAGAKTPASQANPDGCSQTSVGALALVALVVRRRRRAGDRRAGPLAASLRSR